MGGRIDKAAVVVASRGLRGALLTMLAAGNVRAEPLQSPGCLGGGEPVAVVGVDPSLDLRLADGRVVRLPGIAVPEASDQAQQDLLLWLTRSAVTVRPLRSEPDRWGRTVALAFAVPRDDPNRPVSVTEALLDAGRVLARFEPALAACWATELRLERGAQQQRHALWAAPPVLAPGDAAGLQAHAGSYTVVAGRISSVREGRARTYLRFADDRGTGMAASLAPTLVRRLAKSGEDPGAWAGRRLRVRGLLDDRWGWQIEVTEPQQLEFDPP